MGKGWEGMWAPAAHLPSKALKAELAPPPPCRGLTLNESLASLLALRDCWQVEVCRALLPVSLIYRRAEEPWGKQDPRLCRSSLGVLRDVQRELVKCIVCMRAGVLAMRITGRK